MLIKEGSLFVINPRDEEPHEPMLFDNALHYQHGNVKVKGNDIIVDFVFRVCPHTCLCDMTTNKVILDEETMLKIR